MSDRLGPIHDSTRDDIDVSRELAEIRRDTRGRWLGAILGVLVFAVLFMAGGFIELLGVPLARFVLGGLGVMIGYQVYGRISGHHLLFAEGQAPAWLKAATWGVVAVGASLLILMAVVGGSLLGAGDDYERLRMEVEGTSAPAQDGDAALALSAADIVRGLGLPETPRTARIERRLYPDGSWAVVTISEPVEASLADPTIVTEARIYPDAASASAGFEWFGRSRGVELSWTDLEFEPPALTLPDGTRWDQMTGGRPGGGTEVVMALSQKGAVVVYGIIGNLQTVEPSAVPYEAVIMPAFARVVQAATAHAAAPSPGAGQASAAP